MIPLAGCPSYCGDPAMRSRGMERSSPASALAQRDFRKSSNRRRGLAGHWSPRIHFRRTCLFVGPSRREALQHAAPLVPTDGSIPTWPACLSGAWLPARGRRRRICETRRGQLRPLIRTSCSPTAAKLAWSQSAERHGAMPRICSERPRPAIATIPGKCFPCVILLDAELPVFWSRQMNFAGRTSRDLVEVQAETIRMSRPRPACRADCPRMTGGYRRCAAQVAKSP